MTFRNLISRGQPGRAARGPRAALLFAILLASAAAPAAGFAGGGTVTALEMQPVSQNTSAGKCTTTLTFACAVTTDGPASVQYRWEFSDGAATPLTTLDFAAAATEIVTTTWTLYAPYGGWAQLRVYEPNFAESAKAEFKTACEDDTTGQSDPTLKRGRFLVTVNGFLVNHETVDDRFERDGARDEVSLVPHVYEIKRGGAVTRAVWSGVFSSVMGQRRSPTSGATMAGSATPTGGLRTGDAFPTTTPWARSGGPPGGLILPAAMFNGELVSGENAVVVFPTIWEWDSPTHALTQYDDSMLASRPAVASAVDAMIGSGSPLALDAYLLPGSSLGLGTMTSLGDGPLGLGEVAFRPIGMRRSGDRWAFTPTGLVLTYDSADFISRTDFGRGPGVVEFKYVDGRELEGDYSLFVQVERLP